MTTAVMTSSRYSLSRIFTSTHTTTTFLILLTIIYGQLASLVKADEPESRVVGGNNADLEEYPFFASWGSSCGATLIHDDILLTAAHVSYNKECNASKFFSCRHELLYSTNLRISNMCSDVCMLFLSFSFYTHTHTHAHTRTHISTSLLYSAILFKLIKLLLARTPKED